MMTSESGFPVVSIGWRCGYGVKSVMSGFVLAEQPHRAQLVDEFLFRHGRWG